MPFWWMPFHEKSGEIMRKHDITAFEREQSKGKKRSTQEQRLREYLRRHTVSRWMAARATRIPLQVVCWIVGDLRKMDAVAVVKKARCAISGRTVQYITTDPDKFPKSKQLQLSLQ